MAEGYVPVDKDDDDSHSIRSAHVTPDDHTIEQGTDYTPVSASVLIGSGISLHPDYDSNGSHSNSLLYTCVRESDSGTLLEHHSHVPQQHGWASLWLAYQSIGAIYGDIGTSPLYVFSATFSTQPVLIDLIGVLSLIIWALLLIATIKYVGIVLCANDNGEGGSFALLSIIRRHVHLDWRDAKAKLEDDRRDGKIDDTVGFNGYVKRWLANSSAAKRAITVLAVLGVCMVMSDSVLTPAQSILGAVQGIQIAAPDIPSHTIVGITCALIVILFALQPIGTSKLSNYFAPIVTIWLLCNTSFGLFNLVLYDHTVLKAFSPTYAISFLLRNGLSGWRSLGGVLLSFTGVEALFADLGAFSAKAIRFSWLCFALPCLLIIYSGQAAYISEHLDAFENPLFKAVPPGLYWPTLVLSMITSIIASQAMLTGSFQLISQAVRLGYLPKLTRVHTSKRITSQIYIPLANWFMMACALAVTIVYQNTTRLGNAYGVCVVGVSFITTWLVTLVAIVVWNVHYLIVIPISLFIGLADTLFLSAALAKVPSGGWFTLVLAAVLTTTLLVWSYGEGSKWAARKDERISQAVVYPNQNGHLILREEGVDQPVKKIKGIGVFLTDHDAGSPSVFKHFVHKFESIHEISILLHVKRVLKYTVADERRFTLRQTGIQGLFHVTLQYGYGDTVSWNSFERDILSELGTITPACRDDLEAESPTADLGEESSTAIPLTTKRPSTKSITYIVGKDKLYLLPTSNLIRRVFLWAFIHLKNREKTKLDHLHVPVDRLLEIKFSKGI
ncbi:potassium transporter [Trichophyton mentagrophytes]|uniref:Potassium transporter n=1 Tax=Trichophyton interdigitale TaxID=101480 RepID=A0A9P4YQ67_9EURO|nr:Potassium transporter [Trichophyton interdigitale]KAF3901088.1 Potassium transporter [Trichophyton interdigitale]KAG8212090.1 Potassium transporter [Trichophyton interdigitale]GBF65694.1 potassium transporter [Trichophyton mentagrophytes]